VLGVVDRGLPRVPLEHGSVYTKLGVNAPVVRRTPVPVRNQNSRWRDSLLEGAGATASVESRLIHSALPLGAVMILMLGAWTFVHALLGSSAAVSLENVALRHQLAVLQRSGRRPRFRRRDRIFWLWLARLWAGWRSSLLIVRPATVLAWHRRGFQLYWRWKSRRRSAGRPPLDLELRSLIRRMARENPTWGRRRIQAELRFLGYEVAELTVAKYMRRPSLRRSSTWRTFLRHISARLSPSTSSSSRPSPSTCSSDS
jgi:hypothetical protein